MTDLELLKEEIAFEKAQTVWNKEHALNQLIDEVAQRYEQQYIDANKELVEMLERVVYEHEQDKRSWKTILEIKEILNKQS